MRAARGARLRFVFRWKFRRADRWSFGVSVRWRGGSAQRSHLLCALASRRWLDVAEQAQLAVGDSDRRDAALGAACPESFVRAHLGQRGLRARRMYRARRAGVGTQHAGTHERSGAAAANSGNRKNCTREISARKACSATTRSAVRGTRCDRSAESCATSLAAAPADADQHAGGLMAPGSADCSRSRCSLTTFSARVDGC